MVAEAVWGACELLGLDSFHIACEGCFVALVPEDQAGRAVEILRKREPCRQAARICALTDQQPGTVILHSSIGGSRVLDMLSGERLPPPVRASLRASRQDEGLPRPQALAESQ